MSPRYSRVSSLNTPRKWKAYLEQIGVDISFDETLEAGPTAPLALPLELGSKSIGNRFCALPMEGWDARADGKPSNLTRRRWEHFGRSGAKLIWGGEAAAVRQDGRANPNQLLISEANLSSLEELRQTLVRAHEQEFGETGDLLVGLQITHSGRFSRPRFKDRLEPSLLYHDSSVDQLFGITSDQPCLSDSDIALLVEDFVRAGEMAGRIGFDFVDIKLCHGYLGHDFLRAYERPGPYGGSFSNRTRFLRQVISGIRDRSPSLLIATRLSVFDTPPFGSGPGAGRNSGFDLIPVDPLSGTPAPGTLVDPRTSDAFRLISLLKELSVPLLCVTGGSPYYNPHILRPALFPPSDGYDPPEDPLVGVCRHLECTRLVKEAFPELIVVGSGYSYLQEWLPHVAQKRIRDGQVDSVGLGRMMLSYPGLPRDVLMGRPLQRKSLCRTFSDCTTGPRLGLVSGCFPLDPFYRDHEQGQVLRDLKKGLGKVPEPRRRFDS